MNFPPKTIATFAPFELGDTILATPLYRALRAAHPGADITALSQTLPHAGLKGLDVFDSIVEYDANGDLSEFDLVVLPVLCGDKDVRNHFSRHPNLVSLDRQHAAKRQSLASKWDGRYSHLLFNRHQVELNMELAREAGYEGEAVEPFCLRGDANSFAQFKGKVGLFINTPMNQFQALANRQWPIAHWNELIDRIGVSNVILVGGTTDRPNVERLADENNSTFVITNSLSDFTALCCVLRVLVTTDGGAMHAAATSGVPIISLHGTSSPILLHPWIYPDGKCIAVLSPNSCSPCQRSFRLQVCEAGSTEMNCMQHIDVDSVYSAISEIENQSEGTCLIKKGGRLMTKTEYLNSWKRAVAFVLNYNASRLALKVGVRRKTLPMLAAAPQRSTASSR